MGWLRPLDAEVAQARLNAGLTAIAGVGIWYFKRIYTSQLPVALNKASETAKVTAQNTFHIQTISNRATLKKWECSDTIRSIAT
jgi:hypothetical protein